MENAAVSTEDASEEHRVIPLSQAPEGQCLRIVRLTGGRGMMRRLTDLGLNVGSEIRVSRAGAAGPLIVWCKGGRIALGRGVLDRVLVEEVV